MGHIASAPFKTLIDQGLHHPFLYFPAFYALKYVAVKGEAPSEAYARYSDELWCNCTALWTIWVPAQILNFSVVPAHLQIPYVAVVSFGWTIVLSTMRGSFSDKSDILEHPEEITTDEQGVPGLEHAHEARDAGETTTSAPAAVVAAPAVLIPSLSERGWAAEACGPGEDAGRSYAEAAACRRTGIMGLQHPLAWESQRTAQLCRWDPLQLRAGVGNRAAAVTAP